MKLKEKKQGIYRHSNNVPVQVQWLNCFRILGHIGYTFTMPVMAARIINICEGVWHMSIPLKERSVKKARKNLLQAL